MTLMRIQRLIDAMSFESSGRGERDSAHAQSSDKAIVAFRFANRAIASQRDGKKLF
jgi:hypothetical protein